MLTSRGKHGGPARAATARSSASALCTLLVLVPVLVVSSVELPPPVLVAPLEPEPDPVPLVVPVDDPFLLDPNNPRIQDRDCMIISLRLTYVFHYALSPICDSDRYARADEEQSISAPDA